MLPEEVRFDRARPVFYAIRDVVGMAERMTRFALLLLLLIIIITNNNNNHKNNMNSNFNTIITSLRAGLRTGGISY